MDAQAGVVFGLCSGIVGITDSCPTLGRDVAHESDLGPDKGCIIQLLGTLLTAPEELRCVGKGTTESFGHSADSVRYRAGADAFRVRS